MYLTNQQLADLIDCNPTSYKCMKRWLDRNGWPYAVGITGAPKVTREYHDRRLSGTLVAETPEFEPDFSVFDKKG